MWTPGSYSNDPIHQRFVIPYTYIAANKKKTLLKNDPWLGRPVVYHREFAQIGSTGSFTFGYQTIDLNQQSA
jgi:hypothetical protein